MHPRRLCPGFLPLLLRAGKLAQRHHRGAGALGQRVQIHGDLGHLLKAAPARVAGTDELKIVDVQDLIAPGLHQRAQIGHGHAVSRDQLQMVGADLPLTPGDGVPIPVGEGVLFHPAKVDARQRGDEPVKELGILGLVAEKADPVGFALLVGHAERQRRFAV